MPNNKIEFVFFDIGNTLGERDSNTGDLIPYPSTVRLLTEVRDKIGLKIGVITTLGSLNNNEGIDMLRRAGLSDFIEPTGFISEHDVGETGKPDPLIYQFAANKVGIPIEKCLYIGEKLIEVIGAKAAGMEAILKPCPPGREV